MTNLRELKAMEFVHTALEELQKCIMGCGDPVTRETTFHSVIEIRSQLRGMLSKPENLVWHGQLYPARMLGCFLLTDNEKLHRALCVNTDINPPTSENIERIAPGLLHATRVAIRQVEIHRLKVEYLLHKGDKIQARAHENFGGHASNWVEVPTSE